jgi:hypothetical protein
MGPVKGLLPSLLALAMIAGCSNDRRRSGSDGARPDGGPIDAARADAPGRDAPGLDAPGVDAPGVDAPGVDAPGVDAPGVDAGTRDAGSPDGGALDPRVSPADPSGTPCDRPGGRGDCASLEVCRFYSASEGRCETCEPCGNLGASCTSSDQCDILFVCFDGRCSNICQLDPPDCFPCMNIGHPTHGVCPP